MPARPAHVVILTGAGISAESGLKTFRDADGLWEGHRVEEVATPEAFAANPALVHRFYNLRRAALHTVAPNTAHRALARLGAAWPDRVTLVTQNVDDLHDRAGSRPLHMHGEILRIRCERCGAGRRWTDELSTATRCPDCGRAGGLRPDITWFGEMPQRLNEVLAAMEACDLFAAIGTSGVVYPAAGLVARAREAGAHTIEFNVQATEASGVFAEHRVGPATATVPPWVEELLGGSG
ncbi:MAG TPA: NAD-dependent deacylase [Verrucomicrobiota bacterium]|mgnify:CR=1 FL=1|nr:NAD-dependent deacylase [Verrucomicrobiota bacterium]